MDFFYIRWPCLWAEGRAWSDAVFGVEDTEHFALPGHTMQ